MNREKLANTQRRQSSHRLEGSRFAILQLCNVAASGSRERFSGMLSPTASVLEGTGRYKTIELHGYETFPGAACCHPIELPHCKAAPLQAVGDAMSCSLRRRRGRGRRASAS